MITNVDQFIEEAGGTVAVAGEFKAAANTVSMWRIRNRFPPWAIPKAMEFARVNKMRVSPGIFAIHRPKPRKRPKVHPKLIHAAE